MGGLKIEAPLYMILCYSLGLMSHKHDLHKMGILTEVVLNSNVDQLKQGLQEQQWTKSEMIKLAFLAAKRGLWDSLSVLLDHGIPVDRYILVLVAC